MQIQKQKKCWEGSSFLAQASSDMSDQKSAKNRKNKKVHQSKTSKLAETSEKNAKQEAEKSKDYGNIKKAVFEGRTGRNGHLWPTQKKNKWKSTEKQSKTKKQSPPIFRGTYWTEWPFANYAFTNLTMKCSQTNTPAHKNEADQFQSHFFVKSIFRGMYWTVRPSATKIEEKNLNEYFKKNEWKTIARRFLLLEGRIGRNGHL